MDRNTENRHLFRLRELENFKVADNEPDVRGWDLVDREKEKVGVINEFIVDKEKEKVRYLDVVATSDLSLTGGDRHFIIPIGIAQIDDRNNVVVVREIEKDVLKSIPDYTGDDITRNYEFEVIERLKGKRSFNREGDLYDNEFYEEESFYNTRKNPTLH